MSLYVASLNSGSNGNCYYVGNDTHAILVDAGISTREIDKRMNRLGLAMEKVKALFVSHEHSDHITGIVGISRKYNLPVYISPATLQASRLPVNPELVHHFSNEDPITIGDLLIQPFAKRHDAADPYSYVISHQHVHVGVFTDIGKACDKVIHHFSTCHCVFLESNYCTNMLMKGSYPWPLKKRISGGQGHLSNDEALDLFTTHRAGFLSHLILSHLSKNNNRPELVESLFGEYAGKTNIIVASRYQETAVYCIDGTAINTAADTLIGQKIRKPTVKQLSLF